MLRARQIKWLTFIAVDMALAAYLLFLFTVREERNEERELRDLGTSRYLQATAIEDVALHDQNGEAFSSADLEGQWSLVFFGYTHCPDICPMTMAELNRFYHQLDETGTTELPQVLMVTVDPQRDDEAQLREFVGNFHPDFRGLTGSMSDISRFAEQLYVVIAAAESHTEHNVMPGHANSDNADLVGQDSQGSVELPLDHSGHISVINPNGELYAVMRLPHRYRDLLQSYVILVDSWPRN